MEKGSYLSKNNDGNRIKHSTTEDPGIVKTVPSVYETVRPSFSSPEVIRGWNILVQAKDDAQSPHTPRRGAVGYPCVGELNTLGVDCVCFLLSSWLHQVEVGRWRHSREIPSVFEFRLPGVRLNARL